MGLALILAAALAWWLHKRGELLPNLVRLGGSGVALLLALKLLEGGLPGQDLGFIFPQNSPLRPEINLALAAMRADGTLARINGKWFAPDFIPAGAPAH